VIAAADAMSCKVAFERGKERIVYLLVVLHGTSGSLLLVEEITSKQQRGVIRVTAPLAGSDVWCPFPLLKQLLMFK
jgi:protein CLEC16A